MEMMIRLDAMEAKKAINAGAISALLNSMDEEVMGHIAREEGVPFIPEDGAGNTYDASEPSRPAPIEKMPVQETPAPVQQSVPTQEVPTSAPVFTQDQLALAATQLMDQGKMPELQKVLTGMGVKALTELSPERYEAFAAAIRELGAKI